MAKRSNQVIEQYYFGMFRRDYQLPEGTIVHGDKPDVILEGKRKIGIEITNFFRESGALPGSEQIQRKAREVVVSNAQQVYLDNGGKRIELSFSFDKSSPIRDQGKLIENISSVAKNIDGLKTGSTPISRTVELRVVPPVAACPVSAADADYDTARCSQRYQPGPRLGSGSVVDSPAHV